MYNDSINSTTSSEQLIQNSTAANAGPSSDILPAPQYQAPVTVLQFEEFLMRNRFALNATSPLAILPSEIHIKILEADARTVPSSQVHKRLTELGLVCGAFYGCTIAIERSAKDIGCPSIANKTASIANRSVPAQQRVYTIEALFSKQPHIGLQLSKIRNEADRLMVLQQLALQTNKATLSLNLNSAIPPGGHDHLRTIGQNNPSSVNDLNLGGCIASTQDLIKLLPLLDQPASLQHLNLSENTINLEGFRQLAPILGGLQSLKSLTMMNCGINADAMRILAPALSMCQRLDTLNLSLNPIGDDGMQALAPALTQLNELNNLSLFGIQIRNGRNAMTELARGLSHRPLLQELDLSQNHLGAAGMTALAPALRNLTSLESLELSTTGLDDTAAQTLANVLPNLHSLQSLDLTGNLFQGTGMTALGPRLAALPSIEFLSLQAPISDRQAWALVIGLTQTNRSLQQLELLWPTQNNSIQESRRLEENMLRQLATIPTLAIVSLPHSVDIDMSNYRRPNQQ